MSTRRLSRSGFRSADDTICARCHNMVATVLCEGSERAVQRRLLVLSDMLRATAQRISRRDLEQEGIDIADRFFERRRNGERGELDDA